MEKMMRQVSDAVGELCAGSAEIFARGVRKAQDELPSTKMLTISLNEGPLSVVIDGYLEAADEVSGVLRRTVEKLRDDSSDDAGKDS